MLHSKFIIGQLPCKGSMSSIQFSGKSLVLFQVSETYKANGNLVHGGICFSLWALFGAYL